MKRFICFLILFACLLSSSAFALEPLKDDAISISAPSAVLMEKETGTVLYEKEAHMRLFPASVTKVMSLLLMVEDLESGKIKLDDTVTASARAASFGGSCVYLEEGEQMSVSDMLKCIAVVSANDCTVAMAEHLCGTEELFIERMNKRAEELGLQDTHFSCSSGLFDDGRHYTSAYDVAVMSRELIKHDVIKQFSTIWMDSIRDGKFGLSNTNKLVYWYPGCTGLKTGYTSGAMFCLSATAERDGTEYIAVIMRAESSDARNNDAKTLLNYAFASYSLYPLPQSAELGEVAVDLGVSANVTVAYDGAGFLLLPKNGGELSYSVQLPECVSAPVSAGQELGTLVIKLGDSEIASMPLYAAVEVPRIGFWGILKNLAASLIGI